MILSKRDWVIFLGSPMGELLIGRCSVYTMNHASRHALSSVETAIILEIPETQGSCGLQPQRPHTQRPARRSGPVIRVVATSDQHPGYHHRAPCPPLGRTARPRRSACQLDSRSGGHQRSKQLPAIPDALPWALRVCSDHQRVAGQGADNWADLDGPAMICDSGVARLLVTHCEEIRVSSRASLQK